MEQRTVIEGATVVTVNDAGDIFEPGYIGVEGSRIAFVGESLPIGEGLA